MLSAMATPCADDRDRDRDPQEWAQAVAVSAALLAAIDAVRRDANTERVRISDATRSWMAES
jgi:hypothetical protein